MTLIQFVRKKYYLISMMLIFASAIFVAIGVVTARHQYYYPALLFMSISNILNMFVVSLELKSPKGFVLSLFNILFCLVFFIQFLMVQFPVLSSNDWHLGVVITSLYAVDMFLFLHFLEDKVVLGKGQKIAVAINVVMPMIVSMLFYCGVPAWIGLSTIVVIYTATFICLNNWLHNFRIV